jgi:hypothetical protein
VDEITDATVLGSQATGFGSQSGGFTTVASPPEDRGEVEQHVGIALCSRMGTLQQIDGNIKLAEVGQIGCTIVDYEGIFWRLLKVQLNQLQRHITMLFGPGVSICFITMLPGLSVSICLGEVDREPDLLLASAVALRSKTPQGLGFQSNGQLLTRRISWEDHSRIAGGSTSTPAF